MKYFALKSKIVLIIIFLIFTSSACTQPDDASLVPIIINVQLSSNNIGNIDDQFVVSIDFEDGDGDIGYNGSEQYANAFIKDSRTGFIDSLIIPYLSPLGGPEVISGTIEFTLTECCIPISGIPCTPNAEYPPTDEVVYSIVIQDRAGNLSNTVHTPPININCGI